MHTTFIRRTTRRGGHRATLAVAALAALAASALVQVHGAPSAQAAEDPLCVTTPGPRNEYPGPSASTAYDNAFDPSQPVPEGLLTGRYDPQGLATFSNWNGTSEDVLLISAYHDGNGNKVPDGSSGIFGVVANGKRAGLGLGRMLVPKGHVGGIGVYKGFLYVGTENTIQAYKLSAVRDALEGANTGKIYRPLSTYTASYGVGFLGTGDGHLWAGDFNEKSATHLNGYVQIDSSRGRLRYVSATQSYAPKKTQGVVVTPSRVIFSTSFTRGDRGNIWVMGRNQHSLTDANSFCMRAPSMNEGLTTYGGGLYVVFESAAYSYTNDPGDLPTNRINRLHRADLSTVAGLLGRAD